MNEDDRKYIRMLILAERKKIRRDVEKEIYASHAIEIMDEFMKVGQSLSSIAESLDGILRLQCERDEVYRHLKNRQ